MTEIAKAEREVAKIANRKKRLLWGGFLAVLIPLSVLMVLQYLWLADLERTSAIAKQQSLEKFLDSIAKEVRYFYLNGAEKALNVEPSLFERDAIHKTGYYFKKKKTLPLRLVVRERDGQLQIRYDWPTEDKLYKTDGATPVPASAKHASTVSTPS